MWGGEEQGTMAAMVALCSGLGKRKLTHFHNNCCLPHKSWDSCRDVEKKLFTILTGNQQQGPAYSNGKFL